LAEAEKAMKKGDAALKTGLFKWKPDHIEASMQYEKAAKLYKQLGDKMKAIEAFLKWSASCENENENYGTAEALVEAAFLESNRNQALLYLKKAQNFYKIHGS
jgi:tetratricopeptide (TPR) repeat protein